MAAFTARIFSPGNRESIQLEGFPPTDPNIWGAQLTLQFQPWHHELHLLSLYPSRAGKVLLRAVVFEI